jgi:hypothetical protein
MKALSWDSELEHRALSFAGTCPGNREYTRERVNKEAYGQNVLFKWTADLPDLHNFDYGTALRYWFDEVMVFSSKDVNNFKQNW